MTELDNLVDKNGKVKDGYEDRVSFILNELNKAYGTEVKVIDGTIDKYDEFKKKIQEVINTKKAEIVLESYEQQYTEAVKNKAQAYSDFQAIEQEYVDMKEWATKKINEAEQEKQEYEQQGMYSEADKIQNTIKLYQDQLNAKKEQVDGQKEVLEGYYQDIYNYETLSTAIVTDNKELQAQMIEEFTNTVKVNGEKVLLSGESQLKQIQEQSKQYIEIIKEKGDKVSEEETSTLNSLLQTLGQKLAEQTNTIELLTADQISAWQTLAEGSEEIYNEKISQIDSNTKLLLDTINGKVDTSSPNFIQKWQNMANDSRDKYEKALNVLPENTRLLVQTITDGISSLSPTQIQQWADMAKNSKEEYERNLIGLDTTTSQRIQSCVDAINNKKWTAEQTAQALADAVERGVNTIDTTYAGAQAVAGVAKGIKQNKNSKSLLNAISGVVSNITSRFKNLLGIHSPSKVFADLASYIPEGIGEGIRNNIDETTKPIKELANNVTDMFSNNISIPNITKELNQGIKINPKDFAVDTNQYINYSAIKGQILAQSQVNINENIADKIAEAVTQSMRNTEVNVNIEARADEGVIFKKVQNSAKQYVTQTGRNPFPILA